MEFLEIKGELVKRGYSISQVGRELGITYMGVKQVLVRRSQSHRTAEKVSEILGQPIEVVFPEYKESV